MTSIVIIGGGASGSLVATQLLRQAKGPLKVVLVERRKSVGPGVAYSTPDPHHLLNVPAGKMGAFPDDVGHFFRWLGIHPETQVPADPAAFVPRAVFGQYLASVLEAAEAAADGGATLVRKHDEAIDIEEGADGAVKVHLAQGEVLEASHVVLALGLLPGEYPIRRPLRFYHGLRYVHVPWDRGAFDRINPEDEILIVGAGLTAVDVLVHLDALGHRGVVHALSRHGLRPEAHRAVPPYASFLTPETYPKTIRSLVRCLRREIAAAAAKGVDWRAVIDSLRPHSQAIWLGFSWEERARFLRHVRPFWEVHRHRVAPQVAEAVKRLEEEGRVRFHAGRLHELVDVPGAAKAEFRQRGTRNIVSLKVAKVINCTGPRSDYSKYQHPLMINLLARGIIDHDPLVLGIQALPTGEVTTAARGPSGWLYTMGAPLKGVLWESTAIPEIRAQAASIAKALLEAPVPFP